jgi:hypothetical protein
MKGSCSTGQSPQWAVVPMEEEEECKPNIPSVVILSGVYTRTIYHMPFRHVHTTFTAFLNHLHLANLKMSGKG